MKNMVLKNIILLVTAMLFIAGCDQYSSWGPMCVNPVDMFKTAKSVEVSATNSQWTNTGISVADGDTLEITLQGSNGDIPITLCGRQDYRKTTDGGREKIIFTLNSRTENWTPAPSDIPKLQAGDAVYINIGKPNASAGVAGNKWSFWDASTSPDYPGSGSNGGSAPWSDDLDIFSDENNACIYPATHTRNGKKCWHVYGTKTLYRIAPNTNTSPASGVTGSPLTPYALTIPIDDSGNYASIKDLDDTNRGLVKIDPVPSTGYLQFRMDDCAGCYNNNMGGYTMDITRYGCPRKNGEGLVAYIGPDTPDASTAPDWSSNFLTLSGDSYVKKTNSFPNGGGTVWLKIDDPDGDYTATSNQGSYVLDLKLISNACTTPPCDPDAPNHIMSSVVEYIVNQIEGVLRNAQKDLFEGLAGTNGNRVGTLVNFIRAGLVLYIGLYGAAYAFGLIQSPQLDFIIRVMKIAIVIQLLGPNAWNFFNTYFFTLFTDGTKYIIYILNNLFDTSNFSGTGSAWVTHMNTEWYASGQSVNFDFIDRTIGQFLEHKFWIKLAALLFAGPFGWLALIAIVIGMIIFVKGVFKAILAYIISLIAMAMLIGISPLFIIFVLFTQTKDLFEAWIQQLVNYALRPILMFTALAIFNFLMWAILVRMMSYGACWKCILNIKFDVDFLPNMCVLYFYQPFTYDNFGDVPNTVMPISFFAILTYLILAALTEKFVPFMEGLATSITGSTVKASILAPAATIANDLKKPFGMDKESVQRRAKTAADNKKVAGIKRGMIADRAAAKNREERIAGGKGMTDFDKTQKTERKQELEQVKKDVAKGGSIKDRAKLLEQRMKGASDADIEAGGGKGMADFTQRQQMERQKELSDLQAGGKGMTDFIQRQQMERQQELSNLSDTMQQKQKEPRGMDEFLDEQRRARQEELSNLSDTMQQKQKEPRGMDEFLDEQRRARQEELSNLSDTMQQKQKEPRGMDEFLEEQRRARQEELKNLGKRPPGGSDNKDK